MCSFAAFDSKDQNRVLEGQLAVVASVEHALQRFPTHVDVVGPLQLRTLPVRLALEAEVGKWKFESAEQLHAHAKSQLEEKSLVCELGLSKFCLV